VDYSEPWDRLLARLKFHDGLDLAPALADLLVQAVRVAGPAPVDMVLPVPLSAARLRERGHNQAWELAHRAAAALALPSDPSVLARAIDTPHQVGLDRSARAANVLGAFAIAAGSRVAGRRLALVDDVMTTGATLAEATRALTAAGAARVDVWVVARTPAP
jgi:ComF family protein